MKLPNFLIRKKQISYPEGSLLLFTHQKGDWWFFTIMMYTDKKWKMCVVDNMETNYLHQEKAWEVGITELAKLHKCVKNKEN